MGDSSTSLLQEDGWIFDGEDLDLTEDELEAQSIDDATFDTAAFIEEMNDPGRGQPTGNFNRKPGFGKGKCPRHVNGQRCSPHATAPNSAANSKMIMLSTTAIRRRCGVSRRGAGVARMKAKAAVIPTLMKTPSIIAAPRKCGARRRRTGAARTRAKDASEFTPR